MAVRSVKELTVYIKAYDLAIRIFRLTQRFPHEEQYSLTSQIRRSSRSICLNLREAWAKRRYEAHFISKLTDADSENSETETSLDFARDCGYMPAETHRELVSLSNEIGKMLGAMIQNPGPFLSRPPTPDP